MHPKSLFCSIFWRFHVLVFFFFGGGGEADFLFTVGNPGDYWDPFGGPLPSKTPSSAEVLSHLTSNAGVVVLETRQVC